MLNRSVLVYLAVCFACCMIEVQASDRGQLEYQRLGIWPVHSLAGTKITVDAHVKKAGPLSVLDEITFKINGKVEKVKVEEVSKIAATGLGTDMLRFTIVPLKSGEYTVQVGKLVGSFTIYPVGTPIEKLRKIATGRKRRIIYNNDGNDSLYGRDVHKYLQKSTTRLIGSQVDSIFYCTVGGFTFWHDTKVGHFIDRGVAKSLIEEFGKDALQLQIDFGHENGIEVFWSMRMNDNHDSYDNVWWMASQWKVDHPEFLVGKKGVKYPYGRSLWSGLNYDIPEARQKVFEVIEEAALKYDVDGIELDFYRSDPYFPQQLTGDDITQAQCDRMTAFLRRIRRMMDAAGEKRGTPLLIAVRIPDSLTYAKALGLDLVQWLKEGLVDMVIGGGLHRFEPWGNMASLVHAYDMPFYACLSASCINYDVGDWVFEWRGQALNAWDEGVDGIYTFNFFTAQHHLFREMGDANILRDLESEYEFQAGSSWGFLKNDKDYIHAVAIKPLGGYFSDSTTVQLSFPADKTHKIYYTLDGTEPTANSLPYKKSLKLTKNTILKTRTYKADGSVGSPVMTENYTRAKIRIEAEDNAFPMEFFGFPTGTVKTVRFNVAEVNPKARAYFYVTMMDMDSDKEVQIYINENGPLSPPKEVVSGSLMLSGVLDFPAEYLKAGVNVVKLIFDDLGGGTSGFTVERMDLILDY